MPRGGERKRRLDTVIYLFRSFISIVLSTVMFAMLLRSLISILFFEEENKFTNFIYYVTEPFIIPVRAIMHKFNILQGSPIDFSFMITVVILAIVGTFI
ncbi:MAG: YggT family protein [Ruminococcaceae bacterium]|nr:YggT family protein [Oscillospiraceae bacterium]